MSGVYGFGRWLVRRPCSLQQKDLAGSWSPTVSSPADGVSEIAHLLSILRAGQGFHQSRLGPFRTCWTRELVYLLELAKPLYYVISADDVQQLILRIDRNKFGSVLPSRIECCFPRWSIAIE